MGSVISETTCPDCGYENASSDFYYKSDEEYIFCERCGYSYSRTAILDKKLSKKIYLETNELLKQGLLNEAIEILGLSGMTRYYLKKESNILNWTDEEKKEQIENTLTRIKQCNFEYYFKKDSEGYNVLKEKIVKGKGCWRIMFNGGGTCGSFNSKLTPLIFERDYRANGFFNQANQRATEVTYTYKKGRVWYVKELVSNQEQTFEQYNKIKYGGQNETND